MKVTYTGIQKELPPKLQEKLDAKFAKLSKVLEKRGEKEVHVVVTTERHLHHAEITLPFYDHELIGLGSDADLFTAMCGALDRLETQAIKAATKWREKTRRALPGEAAESGAREETKLHSSAGPAKPRVFHVNHQEDRKPMTLEEALLEISADARDYLVYLDADKECLSVLVRRPDGNFDLIEP
ncbi:MAG TPA: ribosome-associated translation inhibitor RaiA [Bryobacteraceae bacterium]|nr:ribosome-associated translation inhibitor RaiA [Bryobacteraceae bacterium]